MRDTVYSAEPELASPLRFARAGQAGDRFSIVTIAAAMMLFVAWLVQRMVEPHVVACLG